MSARMAVSRRALIAIAQAGIGLAAFPVSAFAAATPDAGLPPRIYGKAKARKRFAVWGSYTCPYTAVALPMLIKIVDDNPEKVSLEWHHFPNHKPDPALHVAGLGFAGEHFWAYSTAVLKVIYEAGGNYKKLTPEKYMTIIEAEGGSEESLKAAYADPVKWKTVKDDFLAGQLLGVTQTPGLFYDGYFLTPAGLPRNVKAFEASLRAMLAKA